MNELQKTAYDRLLTDSTYLQRVGRIEAEARKVINVESITSDEDAVDEFYPNQSEKDPPPDLDLSDGDPGNGKQDIEDAQVEEVDNKKTAEPPPEPEEPQSEISREGHEGENVDTEQDEDVADEDAPDLEKSAAKTTEEPVPANNNNGGRAKRRMF